MTSLHYTTDRQERENLIKQIGYGNTIKSVVVDKGHKNGPEIHKISDTGIITIYNQRTKKLITKLIARPSQIARYFTEGNAPKELIEIAREHQKKNYNNF
jgi:hypothetical protein